MSLGSVKDLLRVGPLEEEGASYRTACDTVVAEVGGVSLSTGETMLRQAEFWTHPMLRASSGWTIQHVETFYFYRGTSTIETTTLTKPSFFLLGGRRDHVCWLAQHLGLRSSFCVGFWFSTT